MADSSYRVGNSQQLKEPQGNYLKGVFKINIVSYEHLPDVLNVSEVCSYLRIGKNTCYDLIKNNEIKAIKVKGKKYRIPKVFLFEYLEVDSINQKATWATKSVSCESEVEQ